MKLIGVVVLAATALAAAPSASASPLGPYSSLLVFGDSLSDPGNVFALTRGTVPDPLFYPDGQFTSGDVWATQIGADFASGTNFAFGGATAADSAAPSSDFAEQRALYALASPDLGPLPLTTVFLGGNDLRVATTPGEAAVIIAEATAAIATGVDELIDSGLSDFLVFGLPNLGRLPGVVGTPAAALATQLTLAFNATLQDAIAPLQARADVQYFDTFAVLEPVYDNPAAFGFINTTEACLDSFPLCNAANADPYVYFDDLHPTEAVHSLYAEAISARLAPVPLPASLPLAATTLVLLLGFGYRQR